jgi:hypothetical protein
VGETVRDNSLICRGKILWYTEDCAEFVCV